jgi:hypothetical protein
LKTGKERKNRASSSAEQAEVVTQDHEKKSTLKPVTFMTKFHHRIDFFSSVKSPWSFTLILLFVLFQIERALRNSNPTFLRMSIFVLFLKALAKPKNLHVPFSFDKRALAR